MILPPQAGPLLAALTTTFTQPTAPRFVALLAAAVLTTRRRTVANLPRTRGPLAVGHRTSYQRVLSRAPGSAAVVSRALAGFLLRYLLPKGRAPALNRAEGRPHRTPAQLRCRRLRLLLLRCPGRTFVFVGESGFGPHEVARFCRRRRDRLTRVSTRPPDANLFDPPPKARGVGRPPVKGRRRSKPRRAVARAKTRKALRVDWYGGGTRRVGVVTESAHRFKSGQGLVPPRRVFVRDQTETHRDEYLYSTDPTLTPVPIIGLSRGRWHSETTSQECRSGLGLETTRGWGRATVPRAAPCLFCLYSVVAPLDHALPEARRTGAVAWPGKVGVTFSDALTAVRRWVGAESVFAQADPQAGVAKLPPDPRELLLTALAPAP